MRQVLAEFTERTGPCPTIDGDAFETRLTRVRNLLVQFERYACDSDVRMRVCVCVCMCDPRPPKCIPVYVVQPMYVCTCECVYVYVCLSHSPPFTLQRMCELLCAPGMYRNTDKFFSAFSKTVMGIRIFHDDVLSDDFSIPPPPSFSATDSFSLFDMGPQSAGFFPTASGALV